MVIEAVVLLELEADRLGSQNWRWLVAKPHRWVLIGGLLSLKESFCWVSYRWSMESMHGSSSRDHSLVANS